jgi:hypothetical protein
MILSNAELAHYPPWLKGERQAGYSVVSFDWHRNRYCSLHGTGTRVRLHTSQTNDPVGTAGRLPAECGAATGPRPAFCVASISSVRAAIAVTVSNPTHPSQCRHMPRPGSARTDQRCSLQPLVPGPPQIAYIHAVQRTG